MQSSELLDIIQNKKKLTVENLNEIENLIILYPYADIFPILYLRTANNLNVDVKDKLRQYSLYVKDRGNLVKSIYTTIQIRKEDLEKANIESTEKQIQTEKKPESRPDTKFDPDIFVRQESLHKRIVNEVINDKVQKFIDFSNTLKSSNTTEEEFYTFLENLKKETEEQYKASKENNPDKIREIKSSSSKEQNIVTENKEENSKYNETETKTESISEPILIEQVEKKEIKPEITTEKSEIKNPENDNTQNKETENADKSNSLLNKIEQLKAKRLVEQKSIKEKPIAQEIQTSEIKQEALTFETEKTETSEIEETIITEPEINESDNSISEETTISEPKNNEIITTENFEIKEETAVKELDVEVHEIDIKPVEPKIEASETIIIKDDKKNEPIDLTNVKQENREKSSADKILEKLKSRKQENEPKQKNKQNLETTKQEVSAKDILEKLKNKTSINVSSNEDKKIEFIIEKDKTIEPIKEEIKTEEKENKLEIKVQDNIEFEKNKKDTKESSEKSAADKILERLSKRKENPNDLIDSFIEKQPRIDRKKESVTEDDLSFKGTQDIEIVTERLAEIYAVQGMKEKAIQTYEKLILKYPEKNIYFAKKIEELKNNK